MTVTPLFEKKQILEKKAMIINKLKLSLRQFKL